MRSMNRRFFTSTFSTLWLGWHRNTCSHFHTCWLGDMLIHSENDRGKRERVHVCVWDAGIGSHLHVGERSESKYWQWGNGNRKGGWRVGGGVDLHQLRPGSFCLESIIGCMTVCVLDWHQVCVDACVCVSVHAPVEEEILDRWKESGSKESTGEKKIYVYDKQSWHQDPN